MATKDLIVRFIGDTSNLERGFKKTQSEAGKTSSHFSKLGGFALGAATAVGGALVVGLEKSVKAAESAQVAQARMENQLKAVNLSYDDNKTKIDASLEATARLGGFTRTDMLGTFSALARTTGDVTKALQDSQLATDVAHGKNISLASATQLVTKAELGKAGALTRAGIEVDKHATKIQLLAALHEKFAGASKAYGETFEGSQARMRAAVDELEVKIGTKLLPILTRLAQWLAVEIPQAIAKLSAFWKAHGDQIIAVMNTIKNTFQVAFALLSAIITTFSDLLHGRWSKLWNDVKQIFVAEIGIIVQYFRIQIQLIESVLGGFIKRIGAAFRGLGQILARIMAAAIDAVIAAWNAFHIPSVHIGFDTHIPGVGKVGFDTPRIDFPDIPLLDTGGRIMSTGLAVLHSGEEVVPAQVARGGGGGMVNVYVAGSVVTEQQLEDVIYRALLRRKQRTGALGLA